MASLHPELVEMLHPSLNDGFDSHTSASTVNRKLWWQCKEHEDHVFDATPGNILMGRGCPYCSNKRVKSGFNDIQSQYPELMKEWDWEENTINPSTISYGTNQIVHWKCKYGHKWTAPINQRTTNHTGCPKCNCNHTSFIEYFIYFACCAIFGENEVFHRDTRLGIEIDIFVPKYGFGIEPGSWFYHENKVEQDFSKRQLCRQHGITLYIIYDSFPHIDNSKGIYPWGCYHIEGQLRNKKNRTALINILYDIVSNYKRIPDNISWEMIQEQADKASHSKCLQIDSLSARRPELLCEWDYEKNIFMPEEITPSNNSIDIWWTCDKGHSYQKTAMNKTPGCDICSERLIIPGINHISDVIENINEIWDVEANSNKKLLLENIGAEKRNHAKQLHFVCPHCGHRFHEPCLFYYMENVLHIMIVLNVEVKSLYLRTA